MKALHTCLLLLLFAGIPLTAQDVVEGAQDIGERNDEFGRAFAAGDFNGDGFDDLAVGVPGEDIEIVENAGAVEVIYGSGDGLAPPGRQFLSAASPAFELTPKTNAAFGAALAAGDFDGDGFDDLAIGIPREGIGGRVLVLFGSADGLTAEAFRQLTGSSNASYGAALAAGDFDGDGFDDLAIGAPTSDRFRNGGVSNAGVVDVRYGSAEGDMPFREFWYREKEGVEGDPESNERFGAALAAGDFDGDGFDDLAVGVPRDNVKVADEGSVNVFYGSTDGLTVDGNQLWHADVANVAGEGGRLDEFGFSLAAADFNGDGFDDLAAGAPRDDHDTGDTNFNGGGVHVIYGSGDGLAAKVEGASGPFLNQFWIQGKDGLAGTAGEGEFFGWSLATADFNADGLADLAVGAISDGHGETGVTSFGQGGVLILFGTKDGLAGTGSQHWFPQGTLAEFSANGLAEAVATGDFDGDGADDLAAGDPDPRCSGPACSPGTALVLYGVAKEGLTTAGLQIWRQPRVLAVDDDVEVDEDNSVLIAVLDNDLSERNLILKSFSQPAVEGVVQQSGNSLRFQAATPNFFGNVSFTYTVGAANTADVDVGTVRVRVVPRQDAATFRTEALLPEAVVGFPYEAAIEAEDVDGDPIAFIVEALPDWLTFEDDGGPDGSRRGTLRGTPLFEHLGGNVATLIARDPNTTGTSRTFVVNVVLGAPAVPAPFAPAAAAAEVSLPPLLDWAAVPGAATYDVQVATVATFASMAIDTSGVVGDSLVAEGLAGSTTYFWRVRARNSVDVSDFSEPLLFTTREEATGVPIGTDGHPQAFELAANYPNPFNPSTTIRYALAEPSDVRLGVYDLHGRLVRTLVEARQPAGVYTVAFEAPDLASGTYLYRIRAGGFVETRRMVLLK